MSSIKINVIFSTFLTVSNYLFPLITFPYVSRVLGVNNIGICNFVDSVVHYFILFSMMGIVTTGIREVAKAKGVRSELNKVYSSLLSLNIFSSIVAIIALFFLVLFVPKLNGYSNMFYIGTGKILANVFLIEWLYKGLEEFKFITIRSIIIKCLYVIFVIYFVKQPDDYIIYFGLTCLSVVVNAIINLLYSRNFVTFSINGITIRPYVKSFFTLGFYLFLTSMYISFNVAYLGFVTDTVQVGYYTTATKLYSIIMGFFTAFTGVMLPRMSSLIAEGKNDEMKRLIRFSVELLFAISIPIVIVCEVCAADIIYLIAGDGYEGSVLPMRIVMPLMLVIGYEQIMILQILMPLKNDSAILKNSFLGALVAIILNILLVSHLGCVGTAIVWIMAEFTVLISAQYSVSKFVDIHFPFKLLLMRLIVFAPLLFICIIIRNLFDNSLLPLIVMTIFVPITWFLFEYFIFNNNLVIKNIKNLSDRFISHK